MNSVVHTRGLDPVSFPFHKTVLFLRLFAVQSLCQSVMFGSLTLRKARAFNFGVKFNFSKIRMEPVMHDFLAITENRKREIRTIE